MQKPAQNKSASGAKAPNVMHLVLIAVVLLGVITSLEACISKEQARARILRLLQQNPQLRSEFTTTSNSTSNSSTNTSTNTNGNTNGNTNANTNTNTDTTNANANSDATNASTQS